MGFILGVKKASELKLTNLIVKGDSLLVINQLNGTYAVKSDNLIPLYKEAKTILQHFDNIPLIAWEFCIGGYQPAQKWLKDRRVKTLEVEDILHYQKIIVALSETDRSMKEIDKIDIES